MSESFIESNLPVKWADVLGEWETFNALLKVIEEEKRVPYRQILSHHMTTSCQPGKVPGPVSSLKASRIEDKGRFGGQPLTARPPSAKQLRSW